MFLRKIFRQFFGWLHENLTHTSPKIAKILSKFVIILPPKHKIQLKCSMSLLRCLLPTVHFSTCYFLSFRKLQIFFLSVFTRTRGHCLQTFRRGTSFSPCKNNNKRFATAKHPATPPPRPPPSPPILFYLSLLGLSRSIYTVTIIPPRFHMHLYLKITFTQRVNGRDSGTFCEHWREKCL